MTDYGTSIKKKYNAPVVEFYWYDDDRSSRTSKMSYTNRSNRSENSLDEQRYFLKTQVAAVMGVNSGKILKLRLYHLYLSFLLRIYNLTMFQV